MLNKKQLAKLRRLNVGGEYHVSGQPTVRFLEREGLVETNRYGCTIITDAGREALNGGQE